MMGYLGVPGQKSTAKRSMAWSSARRLGGSHSSRPSSVRGLPSSSDDMRPKSARQAAAGFLSLDLTAFNSANNCNVLFEPVQAAFTPPQSLQMPLVRNSVTRHHSEGWVLVPPTNGIVSRHKSQRVIVGKKNKKK
eukprot:TRINITY_DN7560_c0_g1_i3.p2 TRINITY_DN7560_c0_g1~~TRINITY_DN7560_c0_g1_i3.p2  ORF type:complete len:135 (-),score=17.29 TRINITY_DN7560_c0_g1_i3:84-488(-)